MKNHKTNDYDYAFNICKETALKHYENFPVGSILVPADKRKYIYAIYAFARFADDIADSVSLNREEKLQKLDELDNELVKLESGEQEKLKKETDIIFSALYKTRIDLNIPADEFRNLLIAFRQDAVKQRYGSFDELIKYSEYSANPVGHLVLNVFGYAKKDNEKLFYCSDKICTGLQLINFWQDVSADLKMDRIYIPVKLMDEFNFSETMLKEMNENQDFKDLMKALVVSTKSIFEEGKEIIKFVKGRLKWELKAIINSGDEVLKLIESVNYKVMSNETRIKKLSKLKILFKTIFS